MKVDCPLNCLHEDKQPSEDTQQHLLSCAKLKQEISTQDLAEENVVQEITGCQKMTAIKPARRENGPDSWTADSSIGMPSLLQSH